MDETEWNTCTDPDRMVEFLRTSGKLSARKARLFAVAVSRQIWPLLANDLCREAVEVGEQFADRLTTSRDRQAICEVLQGLKEEAIDQADFNRAIWFLQAQTLVVGDLSKSAICTPTLPAAGRECELVHDVFGNPWRLARRLSPAAQTWGDGLFVNLAEAAYENRSLPSGELDPVRLAVLADALEEEGADVPLHEHLRQQGRVHVRGCWVIDLLLGKE